MAFSFLGCTGIVEKMCDAVSGVFMAVAHFGKGVADSQECSKRAVFLCLPPSSEREMENMASPSHLLV